MEFRYLLGGICLQLFLFAQCSTWIQKAIIVVVNVFVWYLWMGLRYPQSDIKLIIKYGFPGCGKTLDLCKIAVESLSKGRKVYSSIPINVNGVILFDPSDFGHYRFYGDCVVLIDEGG